MTSVNPNVSDMHLSYYALFDLARDIDHEDTLVITSDVTQTVYISTYLYDAQHVGNGACADKRPDAWVKSDLDGWNWHGFYWSPHHYEAITISEGQKINF